MEQSKKSLYIFAAVAFVLIAAAIFFLFVFQGKPKKPNAEEGINEVKELTEIPLANRPFVTLTPTTDGAEIIMSVENMGYFEGIEYELTYQADNPEATGTKIQRGSTGTDVNTKEPKYKKSLLLGTASRGVRSPDRGVEDGVLTMHMFKGDTEYQSETKWDMLQTGTKVTTIKSRDGKFNMDLPALGKDYWIIIADTLGIAPNPPFKAEDAKLPSIGVFAVGLELKKDANVSLTAETESKLYSYQQQDSKWKDLTAKYNDETKSMAANVDALAAFVVVSAPK
ncbi:hypothetical protein HY382_01050 [Candidatus Curtissbacteria bacterium]|nr:hypothetical protein [Candidatus Curtissbacteria bacterium]